MLKANVNSTHLCSMKVNFSSKKHCRSFQQSLNLVRHSLRVMWMIARSTKPSKAEWAWPSTASLSNSTYTAKTKYCGRIATFILLGFYQNDPKYRLWPEIRVNKLLLKDLMPITFSSPRAQPEVVQFLITNESPYFSSCKSKISASNSL